MQQFNGSKSSIAKPGYKRKRLSKSGRGYSRKSLSLLLCLSLVLPMLPTIPLTAAATEDSPGLCEHHQVHTASCGYRTAGKGSPCAHVHSEECGYAEAYCAHTHDEDCQDPACTHVCSEGSDCTEARACAHVHDENCGYVEPTESRPCGYECMECKYAEVLQKMEKDYERDGTLPPEIIDDIDDYLHPDPYAIKTMAFNTNGHIKWENFAVSGLPKEVTVAQWRDECNDISSDGYVIDGRGILASKFPKYTDDNTHFSGLTIDGVTVVRLGILSSDIGEPDAYYYITLARQTASGGTSAVSASLLKPGEQFVVNYAVNEYGIDYKVWLVDDDGANTVNVSVQNEIDATGKQITRTYKYNDVTTETCHDEDLRDEIDQSWRYHLFRGTDAPSTVNGAASFDVTIHYGWQAWVLCYYKDENGKEVVVDLTGPRDDITDKDTRDSRLASANNGYPLGWEPVYKMSGNDRLDPDTDKGPGSMKVTGTFYSDAVTQEREIVVVLRKVTETPTFDARQWINNTNNASNRGSVGADDGWMGNSNGAGNLTSWDSWGWRNGDSNPDKPAKAGTQGRNYYEMSEHLDKNGEADDTYDFTWTFQTNDGEGGYTLDGLELNTVPIVIPLYPTLDFLNEQSIGIDDNWNDWREYLGNTSPTDLPDLYADSGLDDASEALNHITDEMREKHGSMTVATLPDGARVTLEYVRIWKSNNSPQRVYTIRITGATTNVTVTGGNLMTGNGASEFVITDLTGVTSNRETNIPAIEVYKSTSGWTPADMSFPSVEDGNNLKVESDSGFNVRFQVKTGYENPVYTWKRMTTGATIEGSFDSSTGDNNIVSWADFVAGGKRVQKNAIYGPDPNGYYYIYLEQPPADGNNRILLLSITAALDQYMIRYMVGNGTKDDEDPYFNTPKDYDDSILNNPIITGMPEFFDNGYDNWEDGLKEAITGAYRLRYDANNGSFYNVVNSDVVAISSAVPTHNPTTDKKKLFQYWVVVGDDGTSEHRESIVYRTVDDANVKSNSESFTGVSAELNDKLVPVVKEDDNTYYYVDTEYPYGKNESGELFYTKLAYKVYPNSIINLLDYLSYTAGANQSVGGTKSDYYALRLKAVWKNAPEPFTYHVRMVYEDGDGKLQTLNFLQDVSTEWDSEANKAVGGLTVGINTMDDVFVSWLRENKLYSFDETLNTMLTGSQWETYPDELVKGDDGNLFKEGSSYSIQGNYTFNVQNDGTILIYMKRQNGYIPIAKKIIGSPRGEDSFTYAVTAKLRQEDIDSIDKGDKDQVQQLKYMLPVGTYYGWPDTTTDTYAGYDDGYVQPSAGVEVKFTRNTDDDDPAKWYSTAEFTLEGGQAIDLYVPQALYTIEETNKGKHDLTLYVDGKESAAEKASNVEVQVGKRASSLLFQNEAQPKELTSVPKVKKTISGDSAPDGTFTFQLEPREDYGKKVTLPDEQVISITTSNGTGAGEFGGITFNYAGTYEFLITETELPDIDGATYTPKPDSHLWRVVVKNVDGELKIMDITIDGNAVDNENIPVEFTNEYFEPAVGEVAVTPTVKKNLVGRSLTAGEFTFVLTADQVNGMNLHAEGPDGGITATNGANGRVVFSPITFSQEGTYTVTVTEDATDGNAGVSYDDKSIVITYEVKMDTETGKLVVASVKYSDGNAVNGDDDTFTNTAYVDAGFNVAKNFDVSMRTNGTWEDDEKFTVTASLISAAGDVEYLDDAGAPRLLEEGKSVETLLTKDARENAFNFRFYGQGKYVFSVKESAGDIPGVSYDNKIYLVTATVTASGATLKTDVSITQDGKVQTPDEPGDAPTVTFENIYRPDRIEIGMNARKTLVGGTMTTKQFRFELVDLVNENGSYTEGTVRASGYNDAAGNVVFTSIYVEEGEYYYIMRENSGSDGRFEYDDTRYIVKVVVKRDEDGVGLTAKITYYKDLSMTKEVDTDVPVFTNKVVSRLVVNNQVVGTGADPTKEFTFEFRFYDAAENEIANQPFSYRVSGAGTKTNGIISSFLSGISMLFAGKPAATVQTAGVDGGIMPLLAPGSAAMTGTIKNGENIQLRHGQSVTIDLPLGAMASYRIEESEYGAYDVTNDQGGTTTAAGRHIDPGTTMVTFTNALDDPESGTNPDPGTDPGTNPDPGTDPKPGTNPEPGTNPGTGQNPGDGSDPGTGSGSGSGSEPGDGTGSGSGQDGLAPDQEGTSGSDDDNAPWFPFGMPRSGDDSHLGPLVVLMLLSAMGAVLVRMISRRRST